MTVPVNDRRIQYTATAGQTVFPYDFKIDANTEIQVLQTIALTGVTNTLTLTTEYTVSGVGDAGGGDITLVTGAAVNDIITITGATPLSRVTDFNQAGDFLMSDLNDQLDKLTNILQEENTEGDRSVKLKNEDTTASMELPIASERSSKFLAFDASGNAIAAEGTTEVPVSAFMATVLDDTTAAEARATLGVTANTINLSTLGGVADVYTATPSSSFTVYTADEEFLGKVNIDNTGAATLNVASVGAKNIKKYDGAGAKVDVEAGDLQADQYYKFVYDGTDFVVFNPENIENLKANTATLDSVVVPDSGELTIATGAITITGSKHTVDTESDAASDDLDSINGGTTDQILTLSNANSARVVVVKNGTGNIISLSGDISLENTSQEITLRYDGSNWIVQRQGQVVQVVNTLTGAVATGTTQMVDDDSIPQNTEGTEFMTLAITPTSATNKLKIDVVFNWSTTVNAWHIIGLYQDSTANALAAIGCWPSASFARTTSETFTYYMTAGTTSSTTFKLRAGPTGAGTITFNGDGGARKLGGSMASSITITEIQA